MMNRRSLMLVLAVLFLSFTINTDFCYSATDQNSLKEMREKIVQEPRQLTVKDQHGRVIESYSGSSDKLVICVSDRHADYTAQLNIASLIGEFTSRYGLNLVCLEGASKPLDTSFYDEFPDGHEKEKVAKYFLQKGFFTGSEYFKIMNKDLSLNTVGVENKEYYLEHIDKFQKNQLEKNLVTAYITALETNISAVKEKLYNQGLKDIDVLIEKFENKEIELADYIAELTALSKNTGVSINNYPNLDRYNRLNKKEKTINFSKADIQREKLINTLSKSLSKSESKELIGKTLQFKLQKITPENYYSYLYTLYLYLYAIKGDIEEEGYTDLVEYVDYIRLARDIDFLEISDELNSFVTDLQNAFCENPRQERIVKYSKTINILFDLYDLKVTRDIMNFIKNNPLAFNIALIENYIKSLGEELSIPITPELAMNPVTENAIRNAFAYYTLAIDRDYAMINNTLQSINHYNTNMAVLVTGGFHTKGITNILREKSISYVVVSPTPGSGEYDEVYVNRMLGRQMDVHQLANFFADTLVIPLITSDTSSEERVNYARRAFAVIMGLEIEAAKQREADSNWNPFTPEEIETLMSDINAAFDMADNVTPEILFQIVHEIVIDQRMTDFRSLDQAGYSTVLDDAIDELDLEYGERGAQVAQLLKDLRAQGKVYAVNGLPEGIDGHAGKQGIYIKDGQVNIDNIVHEALAYAFAVDHQTVEKIMQNKNISADLEIKPVPERVADEIRDFAAGVGTGVRSATDIINFMNEAALLGKTADVQKYASMLLKSVERKAQRGDFTKAQGMFELIMRSGSQNALDMVEDVRLSLFKQMYNYETISQQQELSYREFGNLQNVVERLNTDLAQNHELPEDILQALATLRESGDADKIAQSITYLRTFLAESDLSDRILAGALGFGIMDALAEMSSKARLTAFNMKVTPVRNALMNDLYSALYQHGYISNSPDIVAKSQPDGERVGRFGWARKNGTTGGLGMLAFWDFYSNKAWDDAKEQDQLEWGKFRIYMNVSPFTSDVNTLARLAQEVANELDIPLGFKFLETEFTSPEYLYKSPTPFVLNFGSLKDAKMFYARLAQKSEYQQLPIFKEDMDFGGLNLDSQNKAAFSSGYREQREKARLMLQTGKPVVSNGKVLFVWTNANGETIEEYFNVAMDFLGKYQDSLDAEEQWNLLDVSFDLKALDLKASELQFDTETTGVVDAWNMKQPYTENLELYIDRLKNGDVPEVAVIPDIHGNVSRLEQILDNLILKSGARKVVFLGDIFDRGTQNLQAYIFLKSLKEKGVYKGVKLDDVQILMGNHDLLTLLGVLGDFTSFVTWYSNGGKETIKELTGYDISQFRDKNGKDDYNAFAKAVRNHKLIKDVAGWMTDNMKLFHVDGDHGMLYLHAGMPINEDGTPKLEYHGAFGIQALQKMQDDLMAAIKDPELRQQGLKHMVNVRNLRNNKQNPYLSPGDEADLEFSVLKGKASPAAVFDVLSDDQNSPLWIREGNWLSPLQRNKFMIEYLNVVKDELPTEGGLTAFSAELQDVLKGLTSEKMVLKKKMEGERGRSLRNLQQQADNLEAVIIVVKFALVVVDTANPERPAGYDVANYGLTPELMSHYFDNSFFDILKDVSGKMQDAVNDPKQVEQIVRQYMNSVIELMDDRFARMYENLGVNGIVFGHTPGTMVKHFDDNIFGIDLLMVKNLGGGLQLGQQGVVIKGFMDPNKDNIQSLKGGVDIVNRINGLQNRLNKARGLTPEQASQQLSTQASQPQLNPDSLIHQARMKDSMISEFDKLLNTEITPDELQDLLNNVRLNIDPAADIIEQLRNILEDELFNLGDKQNRILVAHLFKTLLQPETDLNNAVNINFRRDAQLLELAGLFLEKISALPVETPTQDSIRETQAHQLSEQELLELLTQRDNLIKEVLPFLTDVNLAELADLDFTFHDQNILLENARGSMETADFNDPNTVQLIALQLILGIQPGMLIEDVYMKTMMYDFSSQKLWSDIGLIESFLQKMRTVGDLPSEMPEDYTAANVRMVKYDNIKNEQNKLHNVFTPIQLVHIRAMVAALRGNIDEAVRILSSEELRNLTPEDAMLYLNARQEYQQAPDKAQTDFIVARMKIMRQLAEANMNNVAMRHFRAPNAVINKLKRVDQIDALTPLAGLAAQSLKEAVVRTAVDNPSVNQYVVIEDINGDLENFKKNLIKANVINQAGIWIAPEGTQLVQMGVRSEQVFDFLSKLAVQAENAGSEIVHLIGKQEVNLLRADEDDLRSPEKTIGWDTPLLAIPKIRQAVLNGQIKAANVVNGKLFINGIVNASTRQLLISEIADLWNISPYEVTDDLIAEYMNQLLVQAVQNNDFSHDIFRRPESGGIVLADIGIKGLGNESAVHKAIDNAFSRGMVQKYPSKILGKTIYLVGDGNMKELAAGQRGHAGIKRNAIYIARGAVTVNGKVDMELLKLFAGHEAFELLQWQEKAVDLFLSGEFEELIGLGLIKAGDDERDRFAMDQKALELERAVDRQITNTAQYRAALRSEYSRVLQNWSKMTHAQKSEAWGKLSPWTRRELRKMLRAWSVAYGTQAVELSEKFHEEAQKVAKVPPAQEVVPDQGETLPNGQPMVAPMESVAPDAAEQQLASTATQSKVSYDVGFLVNAFAKIDGDVMRDIDKAVSDLEQIRANLEGSLSQATPTQIDRLERLVKSRKNIAQLIANPRISEVMDAINKIGDLLAGDPAANYDPAMVDYVNSLLSTELPVSADARLQVINIITAAPARNVNMDDLLDVLQKNLGAINKIDDFHFKKLVEVVQAYIVLNVGAQMMSGNIQPNTINNLERLRPVMGLIYNRCGDFLRDNFRGTAYNLAKRTGFVNPNLPAIAQIQKISNQYGQIVDIIENVSFELKDAGGVVIADIGLDAEGQESIVHQSINQAYAQGLLNAFPHKILGKTIYLVGNENLMELAPSQRGHAGIKRNAIYIARGAVTVNGQLDEALLKSLAGHEAVELLQWQKKAVQIFFSGEYKQLISAGLMSVADDKRDRFAMDKVTLQQEQTIDNAINSFPQYDRALMIEYGRALEGWNQMTPQQQSAAWGKLSPWMRRELRKMVRAWSVAYNDQALDLSKQYHDYANKVSPVPPAQEVIADRGQKTASGVVMVAPMETVAPDAAEVEMAAGQPRSTVSYDVGFLLNAFAKVDGDVMRNIDNTLAELEKIRFNLDGTLSQATPAQIERLERLIKSRKNIAQLIANPRISEVIAAINAIGDLLKTGDETADYDPAMVDYVSSLLTTELPFSANARLQVINLVTVGSPRNVKMDDLLDVLQKNLGVINELDDFHFGKLVEAVQSYIVLNVGAQMMSGNVQPNTINNLERLRPIMGLIYNRAGNLIRDNFRGTAYNLAKRTGFVKPDLPEIAQMQRISNQYGQIVDIIENVSLELKDAGGLILADAGLAAAGQESAVHQTINLAYTRGLLKEFPQKILGKTIYLVGDVTLTELAPGQRGHAGVKRNAVYIARGAVTTVDGQIDRELLKGLAGHEVVELLQWQEKAVDLLFSGEYKQLISAGLMTLRDDQRDKFALDKTVLEQERAVDQRINSAAQYQAELNAEYKRVLTNWYQLSRQEKSKAFGELSPWMRRELRKMLRAWSVAYNGQAVELSEKFHNQAPAPPAQEVMPDIGRTAPNGVVMVAPMESVAQGAAEQAIGSQQGSTVSYDVGFLLNSFAKIDGQRMKNVDQTLADLEQLRVNLAGALSQAAPSQIERLEKLVTSRRNIAQLLPSPRVPEIMAAINRIGDLLKTGDEQDGYDPAMVDYVRSVLTTEHPSSYEAQLQIMNLVKADAPRNVNMNAVLDILDSNLGVVNELDDLHFNKLVEAVQSYIVLNAGAQMLSGRFADNTIRNLERLTPLMALIHNRASKFIKDNFRGTANNLLKRSGLVNPGLPEVLRAKEISAQYAQIVDIVDNVSFEFQNAGGMVLADIGIKAAGQENMVHKTIDQAYANGLLTTFPQRILGKTIYLVGDETLMELAPGQRGHAGVKRNAVYIARGAVTVDGKLDEALLKSLAGHEAVELFQWQQKAVQIFFSGEYKQLISAGLMNLGNDRRDQFAQDKLTLQQEQTIDNAIHSFTQYEQALMIEYDKALDGWNQMTPQQRNRAWYRLSPWMRRELRKMVRAWSVAYNKQALELSEQYHNYANRVSPVLPVQEAVPDRGKIVKNGTVMVAPMESVAPDAAEQALADTTRQSTVSYDVGFLVNSFAKIDGNVMRDIDNALDALEKIRANLEGTLSQATPAQLERLERLVQSRKNIAQLIPNLRTPELIAAINKIGDLLKSEDDTANYDPAMVDYVSSLLSADLPLSANAQLQVINLVEGVSPREVDFNALFDVLQSNLGVINELDDFHFKKLVEAVQAYIVLNVGAQMASGNIQANTISNLERLRPVMGLIYNRCGNYLRDNFRGTAYNLAKRTGFVNPDLPEVAKIQRISNQYGQIVDIIENVSFGLKDAGGMVIADVGLEGLGNEPLVHRAINDAFKQGKLEAYPRKMAGKTIYLVGDDSLTQLAPGQRGHAGVKRNAIYIARGAVTVNGQLDEKLLTRLAGHEAIELTQWQEKAVEIFFSGEFDHLISAGLITLGDDQRDRFALDQAALEQARAVDNRVNSFAKYRSELMKEFDNSLKGWFELSRTEKSAAWNNLSPWMQRELRKMVRAWSIAYNTQAIELSKKFHDEANRLSPVLPAQEVVTDRSQPNENGTVMVAPMENVTVGSDEMRITVPVNNVQPTSISFNVGFVIGDFARLDNTAMRNVDAALQAMENIREMLRTSIDQASPSQLTQLKRLVQSRIQIVNILPNTPRRQELLDMIASISAVIDNDPAQQMNIDPALVEFVNVMMTDETEHQIAVVSQVSDMLQVRNVADINFTDLLGLLAENRGVAARVDDSQFKKLVEGLQHYIVMGIGIEVNQAKVSPQTLTNLEYLKYALPVIYTRADVNMRKNLNLVMDNIINRQAFRVGNLDQINHVKNMAQEFKQIFSIIDNNIATAGVFVDTPQMAAVVGGTPVQVTEIADTGFLRLVTNQGPGQNVEDTSYVPLDVLSDWHSEANKTVAIPVRMTDVVVKAKFISGENLPQGMNAYYFVDAYNNLVIVTNQNPRNVNSIANQEYAKALLILKLLNQIGSQDDMGLFFQLMELLDDVLVNIDESPAEAVVRRLSLDGATAVIGKDSELYSPLGTFVNGVVKSADENVALSGPLFILVQNTVLNYLNASSTEQPVRLDRIEKANSIINRSL